MEIYKKFKSLLVYHVEHEPDATRDRITLENSLMGEQNIFSSHLALQEGAGEWPRRLIGFRVRSDASHRRNRKTIPGVPAYAISPGGCNTGAKTPVPVRLGSLRTYEVWPR